MARPTQLDPHYVNRGASLPYGLRVDEVEKAVSETYRLLHGVNDYLVGAGFLSLEALLLGNSLSGIVSEFLVKNIARASSTLEANLKVGGHPDLLQDRAEQTALGRHRNDRRRNNRRTLRRGQADDGSHDMEERPDRQNSESRRLRRKKLSY